MSERRLREVVHVRRREEEKETEGGFGFISCFYVSIEEKRDKQRTRLMTS